MKILVTGSNGRLGQELQSLDWSGHDLIWASRADADLSNPSATKKLIAQFTPGIVIHTAASTDLTKCENDRQFCWDNVALPAIHLARECSRVGARMVHVSTDYVFSGDEPTHPIPPGTRPDPVNYYSVCKVAAEAAAAAVPNHCIFRTTMKDRGPWRHPSAPTDMWISHSYYDEVAPRLRDVVLDGITGIVQFGVREVNVFEFAKSTRDDVRPIQRKDVAAMRLPGDIRLETTQ